VGEPLLLDRPRRKGVQVSQARTKMNPTMSFKTKRPELDDQIETPAKTAPLKDRNYPEARPLARAENGGVQ